GDQGFDLDRRGGSLAGLPPPVSHPLDRVAIAGLPPQLHRIPVWTRLGGSQADAGCRYIANYAQELALRRDQLGGPDKQREARRRPVFGRGALVRRILA